MVVEVVHNVEFQLGQIEGGTKIGGHWFGALLFLCLMFGGGNP